LALRCVTPSASAEGEINGTLVSAILNRQRLVRGQRRDDDCEHCARPTRRAEAINATSSARLRCYSQIQHPLDFWGGRSTQLIKLGYIG
jgi:hypothetical protein